MNPTTQADIAEATGEQQAPAEAGAGAVSEELRGRLEAAEREVAEQQRLVAEKQDLYLRALADLDNFRRRSRQEQEDAARYGTESLVLKLLPILDNFERALAAAEASEGSQSLVEGVSLIYRQFRDALKSAGVEPIEALGRPFDPQFHEAIMQAPVTDEHPENTVVQELQRGYTLNGRVVRPTLVQVAKA